MNMKRKTIYESPTCFCMEIGHQQDLLLRTSGGQTVVDVYDDEQAGENVGGLSRRRTVWDDEEDEEEM